MLDRRHGHIVWVCDECDEELDSETGDFDEARQVLRDEDWAAVKFGSKDWEHFCSTCKDRI